MYKRRYGKYISVYNKEKLRYERVEVSTLYKAGTIWKRLREFINSMDVGTIFTRKQMVKELVHPDLRKGHQLTIDLYRVTLDRVGFLKHVERGKYQIVNHIPDIAISRITRVAYKEKWKVWFLKPEDW